MENLDWDKLRMMLESYGGEWTSPDYKGAVSNVIPRTALLGNGDIGVTSYGNSSEKTYLISKGDFWNCGDMKTNQLEGVNPLRISPIALGGITIRKYTSYHKDAGLMPVVPDELYCHKQAAGTGFIEKQNIINGELNTMMPLEDVPVTMTAWVSATDNVIVIELISNGAEPLAMEAVVWTKADVEKFPAESGISMDATAWASRRTNNEAKENEKSWLSEAVIMSKIIGKETTGLRKGENAESGMDFMLKPGETVRIITSVGGGGQTYDYKGELRKQKPFSEAQAILGRYHTEADITALKEENDSWWKEYWTKSYIYIGNELIERYYYGSLYYMGAGSREGVLAPGIMGIWITTDGVKWNGDYHMNYNFIAPFYGMYAANRCQHAKPLKDILLDYMEEGKRRALTDIGKIFPNYVYGGEGTTESGIVFKGRSDLRNGIENGVLYPVSLGPWGTTPWQDENGGYLMQTYNAAFSCLALTAYYQYTYDGEYLREVYPLLLACADFYEKWCEKEVTGNGSYRYNLWSGAHEETFDMNAPTATAAALNIYKCLLLGTDLGHIEPPAEKIAVWREMTEHWPEIPIENYQYGDFDRPVVVLSEKGVKLCEAGATVNLEFISPGDQLGFDSDPMLLAASRNSIELKELAYQKYGEIWNQINNTPKIYIHAARCGFDPEYIMERFADHLEAMHKNFTIEDEGNVHGIEKAGAIEFIHNMLLFSDGGIIKVFPNWTGKDAAFATLREKGAFLISSEMRDGKVLFVEVTSERGTALKLVNPWGDSAVVVTDSRCNPVDYIVGATLNSGEKTIEFATVSGETYRMVQ